MAGAVPSVLPDEIGEECLLLVGPNMKYFGDRSSTVPLGGGVDGTPRWLNGSRCCPGRSRPSSGGALDNVHQPVESFWGSVEAKEEHPILPMATSSGCLLVGLGCQWHLPIAFGEVQGVDELGLPELHNTGQRVTVKRGDSV